MLNHGRIHQGDCVELLLKLDPGSIDLVFADPPFNIGYEYDVYQDRQSRSKYLDWTQKWILGIHRGLKETGTFWLAIGDEYAAELKLIAQEIGFTCRSWVIWYYTFGINCTRKFNRSHAHLFHFVKNPKNFTFNSSDSDLRVPSARQMVYADSRANPKGRLPDDTWILRPQDVSSGFSAEQDTWYFPRVAGTFKERAGFHGCQMPEQLLGRIVRASSNEGDLILDPFTGSGTTLAVAKKLKRNWIGFELSPEYTRQASERIARAAAGTDLEGSIDPVLSAPPTPKKIGGRRQTVTDERRVVSPTKPAPSTKLANSVTSPKLTDPAGRKYAVDELPIVSAYLDSREGFSTDQLLADPDLNAAFVAACIRKGAHGTASAWNRTLLRMRKAGRLPRVAAHRHRALTDLQIDPYRFASEIAWRCVELNRNISSLDEIFCDPEAAAEFDKIASRYAPGYKPFEYRWAAFWIRKRAKKFRKSASQFARMFADWRLPRLQAWSELKVDSLHGKRGVYVVREERKKLYVGGAFNLKARLDYDPTSIPFDGAVGASVFEMPDASDDQLYALQSMLIKEYSPPLNSRLLASS